MVFTVFEDVFQNIFTGGAFLGVSSGNSLFSIKNTGSVFVRGFSRSNFSGEGLYTISPGLSPGILRFPIESRKICILGTFIRGVSFEVSLQKGFSGGLPWSFFPGVGSFSSKS